MTAKILENISDAEYNEIQAVRSSTLTAIATEPTMAHAKRKSENFKKTDAMMLGSLVDAMLFNPENWSKEWYFLPEKFKLQGDANIKLYDEKMLEFNGNVARFKHLQEARALYDGFFTSKFNRTIYESLKYAQLVIVWDTVIDGVTITCKLKADGILEDKDGLLIPFDSQTIINASQKNWARHIEDYGYHIQTAHYLDGLKTAKLVDNDDFFHILLEKETNFTARRLIDSGTIDAGATLRVNSLKKWLKAEASGIWEGYPETPELSNISHYAMQRITEE